jgi:two-component system, chemotaxis family, CheB/CheR fusion protein
MATVGPERYDDYVDYLELHGEEFAELFNTLLVNTTGFFRDPGVLDAPSLCLGHSPA